MNLAFTKIPFWLKQTLAIVSLVALLPGIMGGFCFTCLAFVLALDGDADAIQVGLLGFVIMALTIGAGGAIGRHSLNSIKGLKSNPLQLPTRGKLIGGLALYIIVGGIIFQSDVFAGLFLPVTLLVATALPALIAISWFMKQPVTGVTKRRGMVAFAGSIWISLAGIIIIQILLLLGVSLFAVNPEGAMTGYLDWFEDMFKPDIGRALSKQNVSLLLIQITIILPIIGTLTKALVTLPLLGQLSRRETFLIGALAGAGFAWLENSLFVLFWPEIWLQTLIIQALGCAIHPLGAGLMALGWQDLLKEKSIAWPNWLAYFGITSGLHAIWNLGFLLILLMSGKSLQLYGFIIGAILILPIISVITLWIGRSMVLQINNIHIFQSESESDRITVSNQAIAIWALVGILAIVPIGVVGLQFL